MSTNNAFIGYLFDTDAVRVCGEDNPFWYTSGTIGPYYVNTHFLYGSEEKALGLLSKIDRWLADRMTCPLEVLGEVMKNYEECAVYRASIDAMCAYVREKIGLDRVDAISGGERRDWFFSLPVAKFLGKPHITLYKDLTAVLVEEGKTSPVENLGGASVLHIADLINEGSSYARAWVPALETLTGSMKWSLVGVDRVQEGGAVLSSLHIENHAMARVDETLFREAFAQGRISRGSLDMVLDYLEDPRQAMKAFLVSHPDFMKTALAAGGKTAARARLCIEKDPYGIASLLEE